VIRLLRWRELSIIFDEHGGIATLSKIRIHCFIVVGIGLLWRAESLIGDKLMALINTFVEQFSSVWTFSSSLIWTFSSHLVRTLLSILCC